VQEVGLVLCSIEPNVHILAIHNMQGRWSTMPMGWSKATARVRVGGKGLKVQSTDYQDF
jgi:hypothetical protein